MKHLVCFHLFNDYSGSPKVLKMVLEGLLRKGEQIDLISSRGGVLDELLSYPNLHKHSYAYRFSNRAALTMLRYGAVQCLTFLWAFRWLFCRNTVFYINTILPLGPALAGRLMGKRVVYHYHENAMIKGAFYRFLARCMQGLASEVICVSEYQRSFLSRIQGVTVIPNAVPKAFVERLCPDPELAFQSRRVLMLGSLKGYKGTQEFIALARKLKDFQFELVLNEETEAVSDFIRQHQVEDIRNLTVWARQQDVTSFYHRASVVLNLTDKRQAIETFGLTALEAMSAGLPVIVPTVGGIAEMVTDGVNGYRMDVQELDRIAETLEQLLHDKERYIRLANGAYRRSQSFREDVMIENIYNILTSSNL